MYTVEQAAGGVNLVVRGPITVRENTPEKAGVDDMMCSQKASRSQTADLQTPEVALNIFRSVQEPGIDGGRRE